MDIETATALIRSTVEDALYGRSPNDEALRDHIVAELTRAANAMPVPTQVGDAQTISRYQIKARTVTFYDASGEPVSWRVPVIRSRRLVRPWIRRQVGKTIVNIEMTVPQPITEITLKIPNAYLVDSDPSA